VKNLSITLVQSQLAWENPDANLKHFDILLAGQKNKTDLIVLPEMFTTGFTMKPEKNAEKHEGKGLLWMKQKASELTCCITGSICVEENSNYYNRLYWAQPDGKYQSYNKRHLFRMGNEQNHYQPGTKKIITTLKGWKILPLVCYDLRFPVWSRNSWQLAGSSEQKTVGGGQPTDLVAEYDVLIYVANWPEVRSYAWKQLLIARAIENQCYVVGVNRIGADGSIMMHAGDSLVINPLGEVISKTKAHQESVETVELDHEFLTGLRKKFPVGLDTDNFTLNTD
jgi:omega-amidase